MQPGRGPPMGTLAALSAPASALAPPVRSPTVAAEEDKAIGAPESPATTAPSPASSDVDAKAAAMEADAPRATVPLSPAALALSLSLSLSLSPVTVAGGRQVFRCGFPGCGREFQLKGNLKRHLNIHSGETKFRCAFCGRAFLRKADMEVHTRVHTGEKPHACRFPGCDRSFARRSDLLSHERTHTGTKPFECAFPDCGRRFARKFDLHKHQRMHEAASAGAAPSPKKRRLVPSASSSSSLPSSLSSSPCSSPQRQRQRQPRSKAAASAAATTELSSTVRQCTQCGTAAPAAAMSRTAPSKPGVRYELTCTENHVHSPPACFALFTAADSIDDLLAGDDTPDLRSLSLLDLSTPFIGPCCQPGAAFASAPPRSQAPDVDESLPATAESMAIGVATHDLTQLPTGAARGSAAASVTPGSRPAPAEIATMEIAGPPASVALAPTGTHSKVDGDRKPTLQEMMALPSDSEPQPAAYAASGATGGFARSAAATTTVTISPCLPMPEITDPVLMYSRHSRSCGHLSIQHGNHRDYVVQNHLVCQDSVKKLGERSRSGSNCSSGGGGGGASGSCGAAKCSPKDSHGPGCGHLPVRHRDHIDYVVEDNLFCQHEGLLDGSDHIELLDDDFWDFYGAVGSLNMDEQQQQLKEEEKEEEEKAEKDSDDVKVSAVV